MKVKIDLSKFKLKHRDDNHATLVHKDGHEVKLAIHALHPMNRQGLDSLKMHNEEHGKEAAQMKTQTRNEGAASQMQPAMADGGEVPKKDKKPLEIEKLNRPQPKNPVDYEPIKSSSGSQTDPNKMAQGGEATDPTQRNQLPGDKIPNAIENDYVNREEKQIKLAPGGEVPANPVDYEPVTQDDAQASQPAAAQQPSLADMSNQLSQMLGGQQGLAQQPQQAPQQQPQDPNQPPAPTTIGGYEQQYKGTAEQAAAEAKGADNAARAQREQIAGAVQNKQIYDAAVKDSFDEYNNFKQDVMDQHVDPNHYLGSMDTVGRLMTGAGLILGGFGGGAGGPNHALDFLNKQIDRDIEAQKAELGKKETLLSANMRHFGDINQATDATRLQMHGILEAKLGESAAKAQSAIAKARGQQLLGGLQMQIAPLIQKQAMMQALRTDSGQQMPAANKIRMMKEAGIIDEEQYKTANKEIERAENTKLVADDALANYDKAVKQRKGLGNIANAAIGSPEEDALSAQLGSTVGEMEGSVREMAMKNVKNAYMPHLTDTPQRAARRREELAQYLKLKSSAPIAESYGVKLPQPQAQVKMVNGVPYEKVEGGWRKKVQ